MIGVIVFSLALAALSQSLDDNFLTIEEALQIAEKQAFSLRIQESQIEVAKAREKVAKAPLSPGAQASSTFSWFDARTSSGFGQNGSATNTNVQLTVSQIIDISGVYRNRIRSAEFNRKAEEAKWSAEMNAIRGMVKQQFYAVLQATELVRVQEASYVSASERLEKARIREQEGAIPRFDVLRLEVDLQQANQSVIEAKGNLKSAKQSLNNLLGLPIETEYEVSLEVALETTNESTEDLVKGALQRRSEIRQAELGILALEQARKAEEKAAAPTLTAGASYSRNLDPGFGQSDETTAAQLVFNFPIVVSGVVAANARTAKEAEEQAKIRFEQLKLGVALEVQSAQTGLSTAWAAHELALKNLELAKEALRLAQLRYDESVGILLDVTTSQNAVTSAAANVAITRSRVKVAYANLQKAVGQDELENLVEKEKVEEEQK